MVSEIIDCLQVWAMPWFFARTRKRLIKTLPCYEQEKQLQHDYQKKVYLRCFY